MTDIGTILDAISKRAEAATPGPFRVSTSNSNLVIAKSRGDVVIADTTQHLFTNPKEQSANAQFIAAARTDIPALVKAVRRAIAALALVADNKGRGVKNFHLSVGLVAKVAQNDIASILSGNENHNPHDLKTTIR
jgi:hypothetical protein